MFHQLNTSIHIHSQGFSEKYTTNEIHLNSFFFSCIAKRLSMEEVVFEGIIHLISEEKVSRCEATVLDSLFTSIHLQSKMARMWFRA